MAFTLSRVERRLFDLPRSYLPSGRGDVPHGQPPAKHRADEERPTDAESACLEPTRLDRRLNPGLSQHLWNDDLGAPTVGQRQGPDRGGLGSVPNAFTYHGALGRAVFA